MPQTLESGIKSEHSEGKRTGGDGAQTTIAELRSLGIGAPANAARIFNLDPTPGKKLSTATAG